MGNCQTKTATAVAVPNGASNDTANDDSNTLDSEENQLLIQDPRESGDGSVAGKGGLEPLALPELAETVVAKPTAENFGFGLISEKDAASAIIPPKTVAAEGEENVLTIVEGPEGIETTYDEKEPTSSNSRPDDEEGPVSVDISASSSSTVGTGKYLDAASILNDLEGGSGEEATVQLSKHVRVVPPTKNSINDTDDHINECQVTFQDKDFDASNIKEMEIEGQITVSAGQKMCSYALDEQVGEQPGHVSGGTDVIPMYSHQSAPNMVDYPSEASGYSKDELVNDVFKTDGKQQSERSDPYHERSQGQKTEVPRHFTFSDLESDENKGHNFLDGPNLMSIGDEALKTPPTNADTNFASEMYLSPPTPEYEEESQFEMFLSAPGPLTTQPEIAKSLHNPNPTEIVEFTSDSIVVTSDTKKEANDSQLADGREQQIEEVEYRHAPTELVEYTTSDSIVPVSNLTQSEEKDNGRPTSKAQVRTREEKSEELESFGIVQYNSHSTDLVLDRSNIMVSVPPVAMQPENGKGVESTEADKKEELIEFSGNNNFLASELNGHREPPPKDQANDVSEELVQDKSASIVSMSDFGSEKTENKCAVEHNIERQELPLDHRQAKSQQSLQMNQDIADDSSKTKSLGEVDSQGDQKKVAAATSDATWSVGTSTGNERKAVAVVSESGKEKAPSEVCVEAPTAGKEDTSRTESKSVSSENASGNNKGEMTLPPKSSNSANSSINQPTSYTAPASAHKLSRRSKERRRNRARSRSRSVTRNGPVAPGSGEDGDTGTAGEAVAASTAESKGDHPSTQSMSEAGVGSASSVPVQSLSLEGKLVSSTENVSDNEKERVRVPDLPPKSRNSVNSESNPPASHNKAPLASAHSLGLRTRERRRNRARSRSRSMNKSCPDASLSGTGKDLGSTGRASPGDSTKESSSSQFMPEARTTYVSSGSSLSPESKSVSSTENTSGNEKEKASVPILPLKSSSSTDSSSDTSLSQKTAMASTHSLGRWTRDRRRSRGVTRGGTVPSEASKRKDSDSGPQKDERIPLSPRSQNTPSSTVPDLKPAEDKTAINNATTTAACGVNVDTLKKDVLLSSKKEPSEEPNKQAYEENMTVSTTTGTSLKRQSHADMRKRRLDRARRLRSIQK